MLWDPLALGEFIRDCLDDFYAEAAALWTAATIWRSHAAGTRRRAPSNRRPAPQARRAHVHVLAFYFPM
jgi:hypothetical protein